MRAVYDDIMATRKTTGSTTSGERSRNHPPTLQRTSESIKHVMAPRALDPLTKEMIYLAVSAANGCSYCIASHTVGLADAYQVPVGDRFRDPA